MMTSQPASNASIAAVIPVIPPPTTITVPRLSAPLMGHIRLAGEMEQVETDALAASEPVWANPSFCGSVADEIFHRPLDHLPLARGSIENAVAEASQSWLLIDGASVRK